ncbi:hypothetical protein MMC13_006555 [Lambiella insularis]|nr:hypothetical protein [Lambiella insularis]
MDDLLPRLLSFPPHPPPLQKLSDVEYDKQIKALVKLLTETSASKLVRGVAGGGDLLEILDPAINTLPYLYTLLAHIGGSHDSKQTGNSLLKAFSAGGQLWQKMLDFVHHFDPVQVRYSGHEWRRLLETVARIGELSQEPMVALIPIRAAILRLDPSATCFTSNHLLFVRLCLQAKAFRAALPILNQDIFHFPSNVEKASWYPLLCAHHEVSSTYITNTSGLSDKLSYRDHLTYFLYGAMVYMGLSDWPRALLFLEIVIMAPTSNAASMIQVEAYKKWVLVGLLIEGKPQAMPKTTNSQAAKTFRAIAKPYDVLAEAFKGGSSEIFYAEVHAAQTIWQKDCNLGLVLQVLDAFRRFLILKLGQTYAALPTNLVAQQTSSDPTNVPETDAYLTALIASGQLNAVLTPPSATGLSMLRFASTLSEGPLARSEAQNYEDLQHHSNKLTQLAKHIKDTDRRFELSREYFEWARKNKRPKDGGGLDVSQGSPNPTLGVSGNYGVDEDMLADM